MPLSTVVVARCPTLGSELKSHADWVAGMLRGAFHRVRSLTNPNTAGQLSESNKELLFQVSASVSSWDSILPGNYIRKNNCREIPRKCCAKTLCILATKYPALILEVFVNTPVRLNWLYISLSCAWPVWSDRWGPSEGGLQLWLYAFVLCLSMGSVFLFSFLLGLLLYSSYLLWFCVIFSTRYKTLGGGV